MKVREIASVKEGNTVSLDFVVSDDDMNAFLRLSGDTSLSHTDERFCQDAGFQGRVVYGGLLLAKLSGLLGTLMPGATGLSTQWSIKFRRPLYIGVPARIVAKVVSVSRATRLIQMDFSVQTDDQKLASGSVQALVLATTATL